MEHFTNGSEHVSLRKRHHLLNSTTEGWVSIGGLVDNRPTYRNCAVSDLVEVEGLDQLINGSMALEIVFVSQL